MRLVMAAGPSRFQLCIEAHRCHWLLLSVQWGSERVRVETIVVTRVAVLGIARTNLGDFTARTGTADPLAGEEDPGAEGGVLAEGLRAAIFSSNGWSPSFYRVTKVCCSA